MTLRNDGISTANGGRWVGGLLLGLGVAGASAAVFVAPEPALVAVVAATAMGVAQRLSVSAPGALLAFVVAGSMLQGALSSAGLLVGGFSSVVGLAALLAVALTVGDIFGKRHPEHSRALRVALLTFAAAATLEVANPVLPSLSYAFAGYRAFLLPLIVLGVAGFATLRRNDIRLIIAVLVVAWTINVVYALRQGLIGFSGGELEMLRSNASSFKVGTDYRLLGAMKTNQDFGLLAAIATPMVVAGAVSPRTPGGLRLLLAVLLPATFYVLLASLLRSTLVGGGIATIAVVALLLSSEVGRRSVAVAVVATVSIIALAALVLPGAGADGDGRTAVAARRASTIFDSGVDPAFQARTASTWPIALGVLGSHPWGAGPGAAGPVTQSRTEEAPFGVLTTDNGYLLIALQLGLQGVALFLAFVLAAGLTLLRAGRAGSPLAAGAFGALLGVAVAMLAAGLWGLVGPVSVLCLLVGLAVREVSRQPSLGVPASRRSSDPEWTNR